VDQSLSGATDRRGRRTQPQHTESWTQKKCNRSCLWEERKHNQTEDRG